MNKIKCESTILMVEHDSDPNVFLHVKMVFINETLSVQKHLLNTDTVI